MQIEYAKGVPETELDTRVDKLQQALRRGGVDGALIIQRTDLFYFSGTAQQGWLYVPADGKPLLMVFKEYGRARAESALDQVESLLSPKKIPAMLAEYGYPFPLVLGMELDVLPANHYLLFQKIFERSCIVDISESIRLIRAVKSAYELDKLRQAAAGSDALFRRAEELLRPGETEVAIAGMLEGYARSLGHQGLVRMRLWGAEMFYGHLLSGSSAAIPSFLASPTGGRGVSSTVSQGAGFAEIGRNEPILIDYVFALDGYVADSTRIFCLGTMPDELRRGHDDMVALLDELKGIARPGARTGDLYDRMINRVAEMGHTEYFMGIGERRVRFTGHGVGLELDEFPFIAQGQDMLLEENMVIALEPKLIIPGRGVVGIENTLVVTGSGLVSLTVYPDGVREL